MSKPYVGNCMADKTYTVEFDNILDLNKLDIALGMIIGIDISKKTYNPDLPYDQFHANGLHWQTITIYRWCRSTILSYLTQKYINFNISRKRSGIINTEWTNISTLIRIEHLELITEIICQNQYIKAISLCYIILKLISEYFNKNRIAPNRNMENLLDNIGVLLHKIFFICRNIILHHLEIKNDYIVIIDEIIKSIEKLFLVDSVEKNIYDISVCIINERERDIRLLDDIPFF